MFSIIMPTFNRSALLSRSLEAILAMRGIEKSEIIIVDDGSVDDTSKLLNEVAKKHHNLTPLRQENSGIAAARNHAMRHARFDYVISMDDDILPVPELLEEHERILKSGFDVSQGNLVWDESRLQDPLIQFMEKYGMQFHLSHYKDGDTVSYLHVYTANLAFPKKDALESGGIDDAFSVRRYGFEDTAFAWKLVKMGRKIGFAEHALGLHLHPWTEQSLLRRENSVGYNLAVTNRHYPEMAADLGYDRFARNVGWQLPLVSLADKTGIARLFGSDFKRKVAVKHEFLRGLRDGMAAMEKEKQL